MNHALLGPEPAKLRIGRQPPPEAGEVGGDVVQPLADDQVTKGLDRRGADFVPAPDREREPVSLDAGVGTQDDVGGGVIRIDMDRVRARKRARGREAQIEDVKVTYQHLPHLALWHRDTVAPGTVAPWHLAPWHRGTWHRGTWHLAPWHLAPHLFCLHPSSATANTMIVPVTICCTQFGSPCCEQPI